MLDSNLSQTMPCQGLIARKDGFADILFGLLNDIHCPDTAWGGKTPTPRKLSLASAGMAMIIELP